MIDLHLHTTASDGTSSPEQLVVEARAAGVRTMAVTDHDTVAALPAAAAAAAAAGIGWIPGIEITAVHDERDVHVLGYFIDANDDALGAFLSTQREDRRRRLHEIGVRLAAIGTPIDVEGILSDADRMTGKSIGRPLMARALVAAGHARNVGDAFERYLAEGQPAFVSRRGAAPAEIVARIHAAGGLASLAHPGKLGRDDLIPALADAGLDAIEAFHPDHGPADVVRYQHMAHALRLAVSGGSDYHGAAGPRARGLGRIGLSAPDYDTLVRRAHAPRHA